MPPLIQQVLPAIAFSKNKIALKVHSDTFRSATPAFAVGKLTLTGDIAVDAVISLSWKLGSATFTAKASPDDSGLQIPAGTGDNAFATQLLPYLQSNYFLNRDFDITLDTSGAHPFFLFTAKIVGPDYNLPVFSASSHSMASITTGVGTSLLPNFMHYICLQLQNGTGDAWQTVYNYNVPLDDQVTGTTSIDLAGLLHPYLSLDIPALSGSWWQLCSGSIRKYRILFAAFYGDPGFIRKMQQTAEYTVVYGGYSKLALQQIGEAPNYLQKYLLPADALYRYQRWFEAWPVDHFTVKTNQPQFLYFINSRTVTETYKIKADLLFDDASSETVYLEGGTLEPFKKVCIGCGYKQLGLGIYTNSLKTVSGYTISLVESVSLDARSLSKSFTVDRSYEAFTRYFLFSDSAGNFKTLRTWGASQLTADITADLVSLQTDPSVTLVTGNYCNSNITSVHNDKVSTGYIATANAHDALVEIHQAKQVFRVIGNTLIPIVITSKNFTYSADGVPLNTSQLEYRLAYEDYLYTAHSRALQVPQLNQSQQSINDI